MRRTESTPNYQEFFLGEFSDPEVLLEHLEACPYLFAIPLMRTVTNLASERHTPTATGPGVAPSLFRTVYSKSLLFVKAHLGTEVKLPPAGPAGLRAAVAGGARGGGRPRRARPRVRAGGVGGQRPHGGGARCGG